MLGRAAGAARRLALAITVLGAGLAAIGSPRPLPPIVFVSRAVPTGAEAGQIPGLGPHGTFAGAGGRLLERAADGDIRALLSDGRFFDVADPAPSPDGRRVAFAARGRADDAWRIWEVERSGGTPRCLTCASESPTDSQARDASSRAGAGDADPAWWGDTLLFVSTRGDSGSGVSGGALYDRSLVTQLFARLPGGKIVQLTHEANGVLDPVPDGARRRLLFSRWWFNPWRPDPAGGTTRGAGVTGDSVNVWQVVSARLARDARGTLVLADVRLASGGVLPRRRGMGVQPTPLPNGGVVAVAARNTGLAPRPGELMLLRFASPPSKGVRLAGAAIGDDAGDPYIESANLRAPAACAPAGLDDGRLVYSLDPGGRGDFGVWLLGAGPGSRTTVVDLPGTWELDAAPVPLPRARPAPVPPRTPVLAADAATTRVAQGEFRYLATDVFAGRGAAARRDDARLRVYRLVGADSSEWIRTVPVPRSGRVDVFLPAETPLFELLTDSTGRALPSAHGPTQVRGFNAGARGTTSRCSGCHLGHSAQR